VSRIRWKPNQTDESRWANLVNINIENGDEGGELDPHGATGLGNPVGGNVTTNATGSDVSYQEWMKWVPACMFLFSQDAKVSQLCRIQPVLSSDLHC